MEKFFPYIALLFCIGLNGLNAQQPSIKDIDVVNSENVNIPFAIIQEVPIFPGCEETKSMESRRRCFSQQLRQHIVKY
ncbi:MAG TPA: hypothetical protein ENH87_17115 [Pricia antarctica]|uniref:Uncharacterized protein n=1 Tax=Pricia antarctica TaxID=641691 RepID=A0A831VQ53_9FLAO|nr:hypothetical protein [Pricia antarctica]